MLLNKNTAKREREELPAAARVGSRTPRKQPGLRLKRMDPHLVSILDTESYEAEQYRKLRYVLEERREPGKGLVIGICSAAAGDGKSLTSLNLAGTLAQNPDARVLLVDTDLRRKSDTIRTCLGLKSGEAPRGLTDLILEPALTLDDVLVSVSADGNFAVLLAGRHTVAPYEALRSKHFQELMLEVRRDYDYVIVDAPPVVPVSDCRVISRYLDGFLMVVAAHRTPRTMLEEALNLIDPDKALGLVFNRSDLMPYRYYGYYGYAKPTGGRRMTLRFPSPPKGEQGHRNGLG